jgi:hypothetical protein
VDEGCARVYEGFALVDGGLARPDVHAYAVYGTFCLAGVSSRVRMTARLLWMEVCAVWMDLWPLWMEVVHVWMGLWPLWMEVVHVWMDLWPLWMEVVHVWMDL